MCGKSLQVIYRFWKCFERRISREVPTSFFPSLFNEGTVRRDTHVHWVHKFIQQNIKYLQHNKQTFHELTARVHLTRQYSTEYYITHYGYRKKTNKHATYKSMRLISYWFTYSLVSVIFLSRWILVQVITIIILLTSSSSLRLTFTLPFSLHSRN